MANIKYIIILFLFIFISFTFKYLKISEKIKEKYIKSNEEKTIFHKIVSGEIPSNKVYENKDVYAFRDIHPVAEVHILIIPKKMRGLDKLSSAKKEHIPILGKLLFAATEISKQEKLKGYKIVINCGKEAGQSVPYLHLHLISGKKLSRSPGI